MLLKKMLPKNYKKYSNCFTGALIAGSVNLANGISYGWYPPTSIRLKESFRITDGQINYLPQSLALGTIIGILLIALIRDKFGRRVSLIIVGIPQFLGFILLFFVKEVWALYFSRVFSGICTGGTLAIAIVFVFVCEISPPRVRGTLISLMQYTAQIAAITEFIIVPLVSFNLNLIVCMGLIIMGWILIMLIPESPYWLLKVNRYSEAESSLKYFYDKEDVNGEMLRMSEGIDDEKKENIKFLDLFHGYNSISLVKVFIAFFIQAAVAGYTLQQYSQLILKKSNSTVSVELSGVILHLAKLVFCVFFSPVIDVFGRKLLMASTAFLASLPLLILGYFFHCKNNGIDCFIISIEFIPLLCIVIYICAFSIGVMSVPYAYTTEMFPTKIRSHASVVTNIFGNALGFVAALIFTFATDHFEYSVVFFLFAGFSIFSSVIAFVFLPETKGKTLEEIQQMLKASVGSKNLLY